METLGVVESVKAVSDLFAPVAGEVIEGNAGLAATPEVVNSDPYGAGWMLRVRLSDPAQLEQLLDAAAYEALDKGGVFYVSLCLSTTPGATCDETHITLRPREWWAARFAEAGFEDATEAYRSAVDALPMQRERKWDWFILRKP